MMKTFRIFFGFTLDDLDKRCEDKNHLQLLGNSRAPTTPSAIGNTR